MEFRSHFLEGLYKFLGKVEIIIQEELVEMTYQFRRVPVILAFGAARKGMFSCPAVSRRKKIAAGMRQCFYYRVALVSKGVY